MPVSKPDSVDRPPSRPPSGDPKFTGYWWGWRWVNGKPIERAPAVSR